MPGPKFAMNAMIYVIEPGKILAADSLQIEILADSYIISIEIPKNLAGFESFSFLQPQTAGWIYLVVDIFQENWELASIKLNQQ